MSEIIKNLKKLRAKLFFFAKEIGLFLLLRRNNAARRIFLRSKTASLLFVRSRIGQHTIEYVVLITLIMAGIIVTGPYVIRSWNANLKGWEDSVIDSFEDPFIEPPPEVVLGCDSDPSRVGCNLGLGDYCTGTFLQCGWQEALWRQQYTPAGCECALPPPTPPTAVCIADPCCCTEPVSTGRCAGLADFVTGLDEPVCTSNSPPMKKKNPITRQCPNGMSEAWVLCGADVYDPAGGIDQRRFGCVNDPACSFQCIIDFIPPDVTQKEYGLMCVDDWDYLIGNVTASFVENEGCTDQKCEWRCAPNYFPKNRATYCGPCDKLGLTTIVEGSDPPVNCPLTSGHPVLPDGKPTFERGSACAAVWPWFTPCCYQIE